MSNTTNQRRQLSDSPESIDSQPTLQSPNHPDIDPLSSISTPPSNVQLSFTSLSAINSFSNEPNLYIDPSLLSSSNNRCISQRNNRITQSESHIMGNGTFNISNESSSITASHINNVNLLNSTATAPLSPKLNSFSSLSQKKKRRGHEKQEKITVPPPPLDDQLSLNDFLYHHCYLRGENFDVIIQSFNHDFKLHKLILSRCSYFDSLFSVHWDTQLSSNNDLGSTKVPVYKISLDHDKNITQRAFELVLSRLYGHSDIQEERNNVYGLLAICSFFNLTSLLTIYTQEIISQVRPATVASTIRFFYESDYGKHSIEIIETCKNFLYSQGYEMPMVQWDDVPTEIIAEIVGSDAFFVPTEWDRCVFLIKLINWKMQETMKRKLKDQMQMPGSNASSQDPALHSLPIDFQFETENFLQYFDTTDSEDLFPLKIALNQDIRYCHMKFAELEFLETVRDICNKRLIKRSVIREAMWLQSSLRNKVLQSLKTSSSLGLVEKLTKEKARYLFETQQYGNDDSDGFDTSSDESEAYEECNAEENQTSKQGDESRNTYAKEITPKFEILRGRSQSQKSARKNKGLDAIADMDEDVDDNIIYYPVPSNDETLDSHTLRQNRKCTDITKFPPFRFSVKFDDVSLLDSGGQIYSDTYWYAGTYWNVYIQKVAYRNRHQLGVYIHRGSTNASIGLLQHQSTNCFLSTFPKFCPTSQLLGEELLSLNSQNRNTGVGEDGTMKSANIQMYGPNIGLETGLMTPGNFRKRSVVTPSTENISLGYLSSRLNLRRSLFSSFRTPSLTDNPPATLENENQSELPVSLAPSNDSNVDANALAVMVTDLNLEEGNNGFTADMASLIAQQGGFQDNTFFDLLEENIGSDNRTVLNTDYANEVTNTSSVHNKGDNSVLSNESHTTGIGNGSGDNLHSRSIHYERVPDYLDHRSNLTAFFEIYTPSRKGHSMLTCFSSTPDEFAMSQSWGWKSASLYAKTEELRKQKKASQKDDKTNGNSKDGLKFMISIGLV